MLSTIYNRLLWSQQNESTVTVKLQLLKVNKIGLATQCYQLSILGVRINPYFDQNLEPNIIDK
jgi:hypothetical protein